MVEKGQLKEMEAQEVQVAVEVVYLDLILEDQEIHHL